MSCNADTVQLKTMLACLARSYAVRAHRPRLPRRGLADAPKADAPKADAEPIAWPWYLKVLGAGAAVGGATTTVVLLLTHERGIRASADAVAPALVDVVRSQFPFKDEDPERRAYVKRLAAELAAAPRRARAGGRDAVVDPTATGAEARAALGGGRDDLDLAFDDVDAAADDASVDAAAADDAAAPLALERAVARRGASVWASQIVPAPSAADVDAGNRALVEQLEAKKVEIGAELASGRRQVDDVQAEVEAIDARLRELRGGGGRARWWRRGS